RMMRRVVSAQTAEIVICGAGIAGIATAYHLAVRRGVQGIVLVDERPPLSLTSDKSAECYRNWWPGPGHDMVQLMNRSIDLLEELARESGNLFRMNRRGYLFATADPAQVPLFVERAHEAAMRGIGPARIYTTGGRVGDVQVSARGGSVTIATRRLVNAAGPYVGRVGRLLGLEIPVFCERHAKVAFNDVLGAVPRSAAVTIWTDPIRLPWSDEERAELAASEEHKRL